MRLHLFRLVAAFLLLASATAFAAPAVTTLKVPNDGVQPQVVVHDGVVHLLYFNGGMREGDLYYTKSTDWGRTFSSAIRVNSKEGTAMAIGGVSVGHLAIGKAGRAHVAWVGSMNAIDPASGSHQLPILYARLNDAGDAFESQRDLNSISTGIDGGGSIAADEAGNVFVVWHAESADFESGEEAARNVFVATSTNDGKDFAPERAVLEQTPGACGCCQVRAGIDSEGRLRILFRSATENYRRDMFHIVWDREKGLLASQRLDEWESTQCVMSSAGITLSGSDIFAAWENREQVYLGKLNADGLAAWKRPVPGMGRLRKHPSVAVNSSGGILVAWVQGMEWGKNGVLAWQVFDAKGEPAGEQRLGTEPLGDWPLVAAFATPDGNFVVIH